jgi:hypothetical protein
MPANVSLRSLGGRTILNLAYSRVTGEGRVQPRIVFTLDGRVPPDPQVPRGFDVDVRMLRVDVVCGTERIGSGESRVLGTWISLHTEIPVQVEMPITPAAIRYVTETARGDDVSLNLTLQTILRHRPSADPGSEPGPWEETSQGGAGLQIAIPRPIWVKQVLEPIGTDRYIFLEIPIPPIPAGQRWQAAKEHLARAEARFHEGHDADVLRHCHDALAALSPKDPTRIVPLIADDAKRNQLNETLHEFRDFLHRGRHPLKTGGDAGRYDIDHHDAAFALASTKVWLAYLARLEPSE